jgi:hypothetical protein
MAAIAAVIGTLAGVVAGFALERWRERQTKIEERYQLCISSQFILIEHLNFLQWIKTRHLDQHRDRHDRWLSLPIVLLPQHHQGMDLRSLSYLLAVNEPRTIESLCRYQSTFTFAIDVLNQHQELKARVDERLSPLIQPGQSTAISGDRLRQEIGVSASQKLINLVDGIYETIDEAIKLNHLSFEALRRTVMRLFPKQKPLGRVPQDGRLYSESLQEALVRRHSDEK